MYVEESTDGFLLQWGMNIMYVVCYIPRWIQDNQLRLQACLPVKTEMSWGLESMHACVDFANASPATEYLQRITEY